MRQGQPEIASDITQHCPDIGARQHGIDHEMSKHLHCVFPLFDPLERHAAGVGRQNALNEAGDANGNRPDQRCCVSDKGESHIDHVQFLHFMRR